MRRQGASIFVYLIFGLLIAIFVLTINPSSGQGGGCTPASNTWLTVNGNRVHKNDYHVAYNNRFNPERGKERVHAALEMLIRRELLAQAAEERGLRVTDDMVEEEIKKGHFFFGGFRVPMGPSIFEYQRSQICEPENPAPDFKAPPECAQKCLLQQGMQFNMCGKGYTCAADPEADEGEGAMGLCDARCTPGGTQCGAKETCTEEGRCALWSPAKFKSWLAQLNISKKSYLSEQARNMQANLMHELLVGSVRVAREEAREAFIYNKTTVTYEVVAFNPAEYRKRMKLSDADTQRYLAAHEDAVKAKFKADERTYKDVKPQVKLRQIFIAKLEPPAEKPDDKKPDDKKPDDKKPDDAKKPDDKKPGDGRNPADDKKPVDKKPDAKKPDDKKPVDAKADDKKPGDKKPDAKKPDNKKPDAKKPDDKKPDDKKPAVGMPIADAVKKLKAARTEIAAKRKKFVDAVKELATDETEKANGGDLGWKTAESAGLGDPVLSDAVKALKPGEMTDVLTTDRGAFLILVEDKRPVGDSKDLTYDQVKLEIAASLAKDAWSKEKAKRDALDAHADLVKSGKKLSDMFKPDPSNPAPEMDPDVMERLRQQMMEQGMKSGALNVDRESILGSIARGDDEFFDMPIGWKYEDPNGPSGSGSAAKTGSAAPTSGSAAKTGSATPTGGSAAGSGTGTGSGSAAPPPTPTPDPPQPIPAGPAIEPTKEQLPTFGEVEKPMIAVHGPTARRATLPGVGKDLVPVLFDQLQPGKLAPRIYETPDGGYVLVQLSAKGEPKLDEFEKTAYLLTQKMRLDRAGTLLSEWLNTRCEALAKDEKITPLKDLLIEYDEKTKTEKLTNYRVCQSFKPGAGF